VYVDSPGRRVASQKAVVTAQLTERMTVPDLQWLDLQSFDFVLRKQYTISKKHSSTLNLFCLFFSQASILLGPVLYPEG
jgi:hypothetical protein